MKGVLDIYSYGDSSILTLSESAYRVDFQNLPQFIEILTKKAVENVDQLILTTHYGLSEEYACIGSRYV